MERTKKWTGNNVGFTASGSLSNGVWSTQQMWTNNADGHADMAYDEDMFIRSPDGRFLNAHRTYKSGGVFALTKSLAGGATDKGGSDFLFRLHMDEEASDTYVNPNSSFERLKKASVNHRVKNGDLVYLKVRNGGAKKGAAEATKGEEAAVLPSDLWLVNPTGTWRP